MLNAIVVIGYETKNYFYNVLDIIKDIRRPWDLPMLPPEYFKFG